MKYTAAIIAALAARVSAVSEPAAQATPMLTAPQGECQPSVDGPFKLTVVEEKKEKRGLDLEVNFPPCLPRPFLPASRPG